ncbi:MAG TPA: hypothetical protein VMA72_03800 [Streptosporangiaceae bacterium]|nr:hypothetical protein [Streptosporangiaceae bacterium]
MHYRAGAASQDHRGVLVVVWLPHLSGLPYPAIQIAVWRVGDARLRVATVTNLGEQTQIQGWDTGLEFETGHIQ